MFVALGTAWGLALVVSLLFRFALRPDPRVRLTGVAIGALVLLPIPLLVPVGTPGSTLLRWAVAVHCAVTAGKLFDLHRGYPKHGRPPLGPYLSFMATTLPFDHVFRRIGDEPGPDDRVNVRRLIHGFVEATLGIALFAAVVHADLGRYGFLLDHVTKCVALYPILDGALAMQTAMFRLLALPARDVLRDPILARTPAQFWRLYNRPVNEYLIENVWKPSGGKRAPIRGTLIAFFVSGAVHEYLFAIATVKITGYQIAFFMLHGFAVVATLRVRPRGPLAPVGVLATNTFLALTLILFAADVDRVLRDFLTLYPHGGLLPG